MKKELKVYIVIGSDPKNKNLIGNFCVSDLYTNEKEAQERQKGMDVSYNTTKIYERTLKTTK